MTTPARPADHAPMILAIMASVVGLTVIGLAGAPAWTVGAASGACLVGVYVLARRPTPRSLALERQARSVAELAGLGPGADPEEAVATLRALLLTESARAEEVRVVLHAAPEPLIVTDSTGEVVMCSAAAQAFLDLPGERIVGRPLEEVFTQAELLDLHRSARRGQARREQIPLPTSSGVRIFDVAVCPTSSASRSDPLPTDEPFGAVMSLRDVTELARAVQVKADFVANASHELRTPIAAVRMAVETLSGVAHDDPDMRERLIKVLATQSARLEEMVRDLLDLSRLESPELKVVVTPIRGSELAARLLPMFEGVCRDRSITIRFELDPDFERLRTDRNLLILILKNLIENAAKFAYEGTEIRVVGTALPQLSTGPDGRGAADHRAVRFEVIDRGIGIPINQQQRVFERFYQVDEARTGPAERRGTGLGLAIVKYAVRTLGGQVRLQSVWKQGTTFTVDLPGCLPPPEPEKGADAESYDA